MKPVSLNIEDFFNLPSAVIYNPDDFKLIVDVSIDSRQVKKGSLFIAIKGKNLDGHNFIKAALIGGADAVMIDKKKYKHFKDIDIPLITVDNTTQALGNIAKTWRNKIKAKVIGITGSSGKTSTKEILSAILSEKFNVNKTELNNNNHIGVPLTILSTTAQHDVLIAEVGTNHFGEIAYSSKILQPDLAVITNIGSSHTEFLKNKKGVLKEKSALLNQAIRRNGKIFLNYDDPLLKNQFRKYRDRITFGFNPEANVSGKILDYTNNGKPEIQVKFRKKNFSKILPVYGESNAQNFLTASAIALNLGLSESEIKKGADKIKFAGGRLEVIDFKSFTLIDDTYNANPESTIAAIELAGRIKNHLRKILILGDMLELGKERIKFHKELKKYIIKNEVTEVYTIGNSMKHLSQALPEKKIIKKHFHSRSQLKKLLQQTNLQDAVVLVKGSRGMRMEEFVELIKGNAGI